MTTIHENITLYKTFNMSEHKVWGNFKLEVVDDGVNQPKARVHSNNLFAHLGGNGVSRFNKMGVHGFTSKKHCSLTVNGHKVYFMLPLSENANMRFW